MTDSSLLDDVKALFDHGFEDDRILKQIYRACQRDEVISNYERNYVRKLTELHLRKRPQFDPPLESANSTPLPIPDVVLPQIRNTLQIQPLQATSSSSSFFSSKKKKLVLGLSIIIILGISIAAATATLTITGPFTDPSSIIDPTVTPISDTLSVQTDLPLYAHKDLISISGTSNTDGFVNLIVENSNYETVWQEQLSLKNNGKFSTLIIAGGSGWEKSGIYTLTVENDAGSTFVTFSFTR